MTAERLPVSIICVFNDPVVRERCLDRSIRELRREAPDLEYLPIDNVDGRFPTAGAALNHGARLAGREYLVFVHQDVYLHSLGALEAAAASLAGDNGFGLLGAIGPTADGEMAGLIRDRVLLLGRDAPRPVDVDSLDEVLFLTSRSLILDAPLSENPDLAWHAYAVEYGLRMRRRGLRVGAVNIPLTHNSLTINLARLDVAHHAVAEAYPEHLPVQTTCGPITRPDSLRRKPLLPSHRWRFRWLTNSWTAHSARRAAGGGPFVLRDIRMDIDDVIAAGPDPFPVFNLDPNGLFRVAPLELHRRHHRVRFYSGDAERLTLLVRERDPATPLLVTNLDVDTLRQCPELTTGPHLTGLHQDYGLWLLLEPRSAGVPDRWRERAAVPLGMSAPVKTDAKLFTE